MNNATVTVDGKEVPLYEATQKQREYERAIRKTKRELAGYAAGAKEADGPLKAELDRKFTLESLTLKKQRERLADFEKQTGLMTQAERQQVYGFGRSEASRASWAVRKALDEVKSFDGLSGIKTSNGIEIAGLTQHFGERARERGITYAGTSQALINPLDIGRIRTDGYGARSQTFVGEKATVVINPDTGVIVTTYTTGTKRAEKLRKRKESD